MVRELRHTHTYTAEKNCKDKTVSVNTAFEHRLPLNRPLLEVVRSLMKAHGSRFPLLTILAKLMIPTFVAEDSNLAVIQSADLATSETSP